MVDLRQEISDLLAPIAPTDYYYPPAGSTFPHISYFQSGSDSNNYFDGKATTNDLEFTIDCWERVDPTTGILTEIHDLVDTTMRNNQYRRVSFVSLYEVDVKLYHYSMKFKKVKEEN